MKTILCLSLGLFLSACGDYSADDAKQSLSDAKESAEAFAEKHDLANHPAVKKAEAVAEKATEALVEACKEHPELADLSTKVEELKEDLKKAVAENKEDVVEKTRAAYEQARKELATQAEKFPELESLADETKKAGKAVGHELKILAEKLMDTAEKSGD